MLSFPHLFTYKVLKPVCPLTVEALRFTPLFTYKVLKPLAVQYRFPQLFYTFIHLQGYQTLILASLTIAEFYTFIHLRGSQTSN